MPPINRRRALSTLLLACPLAAAGQGSFHPRDPLSDPGFVAFFNNDYDAAIAAFTVQVKQSPDDAGAQNHLAQAVLYRELFRNGALESQLVSGNNPFLKSEKVKIAGGDKSRLMAALDRAGAISAARIAANGSDVRAHYEAGVTHGLRANYFFLVEKAWTESLREATYARKAQERVLELDPKFVDANLILGIYQYVVGSLPLYLRLLGFIGGFHGDRDEGIRKLELVAREGVLNRYDAQVVLAVLYRREEKPRKAIPLLEQLASQFPRNNLFRFEQVQMYSDLGDKTSAMRVLTAIEDKRKSGAPGYSSIPAAKVQYVWGNLNFWYGDIPAAENNLRAATAGAKQLDLGMSLLAWLRLGQVMDLQGRHGESSRAYQSCIALAPESEVASEAKGYLDKPYKRKKKT